MLHMNISEITDKNDITHYNKMNMLQQIKKYNPLFETNLPKTLSKMYDFKCFHIALKRLKT